MRAVVLTRPCIWSGAARWRATMPLTMTRLLVACQTSRTTSAVAHLAPALVVLLVWQATNSLVIVNGIVARQRAAPDQMQGRVNTTARMIAWGGQPLGAALGGVLAGAYGVRTALLITGCAVLAAAVAGWATPLRTRHPTIAGPTTE